MGGMVCFAIFPHLPFLWRSLSQHGVWFDHSKRSRQVIPGDYGRNTNTLACGFGFKRREMRLSGILERGWRAKMVQKSPNTLASMSGDFIYIKELRPR